MAILKILKYPHPALRTLCEPVTVWDADLQKIIENMKETMYDCSGAVGLAANQVGVTLRVIVMDTAAKTTRDQFKVLINPEIVVQSRNKTVREGCLSLPEYLANTKRATKLTVKALNEHQQEVIYEVRDLEAIAVQHEIDHLDGVLMIDRVQSIKTDLIRRTPR